MPQKTIQQNGGERLRKWYETRMATLSRLSVDTPRTLCVEELNLTICCRYLEALLRNSRIKRYLLNNHSEELYQIEKLLDDFRRESGP